MNNDNNNSNNNNNVVFCLVVHHSFHSVCQVIPKNTFWGTFLQNSEELYMVFCHLGGIRGH